MNETKFRVWIKDIKKMFYPIPFISGKTVTEEDLFIKLDGTVCWSPSFKTNSIDKIENELVKLQYTGLKDINGKEIYEGDLIKMDRWEMPNKKIEIVTLQGGGFFPFCIAAWKCVPQPNEVEVIGNICENLELLK